MSLSRRQFIIRAACSAMVFTVPAVTIAGHDLGAGMRAATPAVTTLSITEGPSTVVRLLENAGWAHVEGPTGGGWQTGKADLPGGARDASLVLLDEERGPSGRALTPKKLQAGMPVQASSLSFRIAPSQDAPSCTQLARQLRATCGIPDSAVLQCVEPDSDSAESADYAFHAEVCSCVLGNKTAVWWLTAFGHVQTDGLTCSLGAALLDYYARSRLIRPDYADVVAAEGPWDIPTDKEFRAMSASEAYAAGTLDTSDAN